jgi:hypothetical protein
MHIKNFSIKTLIKESDQIFLFFFFTVYSVQCAVMGGNLTPIGVFSSSTIAKKGCQCTEAKV